MSSPPLPIGIPATVTVPETGDQVSTIMLSPLGETMRDLRELWKGEVDKGWMRALMAWPPGALGPALTRLYPEMPARYLTTAMWPLLLDFYKPEDHVTDWSARPFTVLSAELHLRWGPRVVHDDRQRVDVEKPAAIASRWTRHDGTCADWRMAADRKFCSCAQQRAAMDRTFECPHLQRIRHCLTVPTLLNAAETKADGTEEVVRTAQFTLELRDEWWCPNPGPITVILQHVQGQFLAEESATCTCPHRRAHPRKDYWCEHIRWMAHRRPSQLLRIDEEPEFVQLSA